MKVYLNNSQTPLKTEILPSNTPTLDETLETFSFALISNESALPLAPMQIIKVDFEDGETPTYFYLISDSVETYSLYPLKYKHTISCIQNTRKLSKHLVRNSVFSQPATPKKEAYNSVGCGYVFGDTSHRYFDRIGGSRPLNVFSLPLILETREKIKNIKVRLELKAAIYTSDGQSGSGHPISDGTVTWNEDQIKEFSELPFPTGLTPSLTSSLVLRYKLNGTSTSISFTPSMLQKNGANLSQFVFNQDLDSNKILEVISQGGTELELLFNDSERAPIQCEGYSGTKPELDGNLVSYIFSTKIIAETYYYSAYDILNLLIERQKKETSNNSLAPLFSLPQSGDLYDLLTNTIAPNFTFTQLTMYECVAEVFRLFDAIFNMDENGVLGIEYFNDLSKETIEPKITNRTLSISEDKYTNGLETYYQDGRIEETFPSIGQFAHLRCDHVGVPASGEHYFIVDHPIQSVSKFYTQYNLKGYYTTNTAWVAIPATNSITIDLSHYIVDYDLWNTLNVGSITLDDLDKQYQINTAYFIKGDNKINVAYSQKSAWGTTEQSWNAILESGIALLLGGPFLIISGSPDWSSIILRATYVATIDGKTKIHNLKNKYDGETLVDQYNGAVDLNKMGLNMLGLSLKLGNPTLNATHKITKWANRIKIGQIYNYQGGLWVANVVSYTFFGGYIQGKVSFVQNFNQLALRTQLLREKRMSNISKELTQKSEEVLTDFVYYSSNVKEYTNETIYFDYDCFADLLFGTFSPTDENETVKFATIYDNDATPVLFFVTAIYIPLVKYGAGNTINFEMSFESPMSAGLQTKVGTGWFGTSDYATFNVKYTDDNGFLDKISIQAPKVFNYFTRAFPSANIAKIPNQNTSYFNIQDFKVYKQPNEIFALNYQLAFLPFEPEVDFLGSQFINDNAFIKGQTPTKKIYICFKEEKSSVLDTKAAPYFLKKTIATVQTNYSGNNYHLNFLFSTISADDRNKIKSWCLVDENENVLFASNRDLISRNFVDIYFITRKNRIPGL